MFLYQWAFIILLAAVVVQFVTAFAPQSDGWLFESQPRKTYVVKTDSDNPKLLAIGVNIRIIGDVHYKWMSCVTIGVVCQKTLTAQWSEVSRLGQYLPVSYTHLTLPTICSV